MWSEFKNGALPVPDLRNLDIYHEIGVGLALEDVEMLSDDAYRALYREKLAEWDSVYPISPDARMWRGVKPDAPALVGRRAVA